MNQYLACISFVALGLCLAGAVTREELEKSIFQVNSGVRAQENIAIGNASRDAMSRATTPSQKICIATKMGPAYRDLNLALSQELAQQQNDFLNRTPEEIQGLDAASLVQALYGRNMAASTAQASIDQINSC